MEIVFNKLYLKNLQTTTIKEILVLYSLSAKMCEELKLIMSSKKSLVDELNFKEVDSVIKTFEDCLNSIEYRYIDKLSITLKDNYLYISNTYNSFIASAIAKGVKFDGKRNNIKLTDFEEFKKKLNEDIVVKFDDKEDFASVEGGDLAIIVDLIQKIFVNELNFSKGADLSKINFEKTKSIEKIEFPKNIVNSISKIENVIDSVKRKLDACDYEFLQNVNIAVDKLFDISRSNGIYLNKALKMEKLTNNFKRFEVRYQKLSDVITKNQSNINQLNLKYKKYVKELGKVKSEIEVVKDRINQLREEVEKTQNQDEKYKSTITIDNLTLKVHDLQYKRSLNKILETALDNKIDYFNTLNDALVIDVENKIQQENKIIYNFKTFLPVNSEIEKYKKINIKIDNQINDITRFVKDRKNDVTTKFDKYAYKMLLDFFKSIKDLVSGFAGFFYKNSCANCLFNLPFLIRNKNNIKTQFVSNEDDKYLEVSEEKFILEKKEKFEEKNRQLLKICNIFRQYLNNLLLDFSGKIEVVKELEYNNLVNYLTNLKAEISLLKENYIDLNNNFNDKVRIMQDLLLFYVK